MQDTALSKIAKNRDRRNNRFEVVVPCETLSEAQEVVLMSKRLKRMKRAIILRHRPRLFYSMAMVRRIRIYRVKDGTRQRVVQVIDPEEINLYWKKEG